MLYLYVRTFMPSKGILFITLNVVLAGGIADA